MKMHKINFHIRANRAELQRLRERLLLAQLPRNARYEIRKMV